MKRFKKLIFSAIAMACLSTSPLMAASSDFAGPYVGLNIAAAGFELEGEHKDSNNITTTGKGGFVTPIAGIDVGYNIPLGDMFIMDIQVSLMDTDGVVKGDDATDASEVTIRTGKHGTISLAPTIAFSDSSAVYAKVGWSMMQIHATGNVETDKYNMEGLNLAFGTVSLFPSGMFVKTEAGVHMYDSITWNGLSCEDCSSGNGHGTLKTDPTMAYGAFKIGYKF